MFNFFKFAGIEDRLQELGADKTVINYVLGIPEKERGFYFKTFKDNQGLSAEQLLAKFDEVKQELFLKNEKLQEGRKLRTKDVDSNILDQIKIPEIKLWATRELIKNKELNQNESLLKHLLKIESVYNEVSKTFFLFDLATFGMEKALMFCNAWEQNKDKILKLNNTISTELNRCEPEIKEFIVKNLQTFDDFDKNSMVFNIEGDKKVKALNHFYTETHPPLDKVFATQVSEAVEWEATFTNTKVNFGYDPLNEADIVFKVDQKAIENDPELQQYSGYFIVSLESENDYKVEGSTLNHCLGTSDYFRRKENGEIKVFSLRTPSNIPKVTIQTTADLWGFQQTFAYGNTEPSGFLMTLVNKWKRILHPSAEVKDYVLSKNPKQNIQASQFIEEITPEDSELIDLLISKDSSKPQAYRASASANEIKSILEGLAQNEGLNKDRYDAIYKLADSKKYERVIFYLARNKNISNEIMNAIFINYSDNDEIIKNLSVNMSLKNNPELVNKLFKPNSDIYVMYNLSISSSMIMNLLKSKSASYYMDLFDRLVKMGRKL